MSSQSALQYYCSNCKTILREAESELDLSCISEPCPFCGSLLSESLQKRQLAPKMGKPVIFQSASQVPKLAIDIKKLDSAIPFLSLNQKVAVVGHDSQKLIERLAVRAQLPHRYGGLDSHVVVVDGGNSSDPYLCINFARQYGLDVTQVLSKIISSRAFTVHQLESLISHELPAVIKKYNARLVILSDLLAMFSEPRLDRGEATQLLGSISRSISKLKECLVVISISRPTKYDGTILQSFDRIIHLSDKDGTIAVDLGDRNCIIKENDLEVIPRR